jgi:hypothetical protein
MAFVHVSLLAGLWAVAIPVIVHLIFRRRARSVDLGTCGSLLFWAGLGIVANVLG